MKLNSKQICEYAGGSFIVEPIDATKLGHGISWDSRTVMPNDVYIALPGDRVDGHLFVDEALRNGASIILIADRPTEETCLLAKEMGAALIEVPNTASALVDIAYAWRKKIRGKVIGVTGSSGKTTTKNLLRDVLKGAFSVVATEANQNNELGVPKTILSADVGTQVIVVEMGMRGKGQIAELCEYVMPDMGLITNIGDGHIELLGTRENIASAKAELFGALPDRIGKAFIHQDENSAKYIREFARLEERDVETIYFGGQGTLEKTTFTDSSDISQPAVGILKEDKVSQGAWASDVVLDPQGRPHFTMHIGDQSCECMVQLRGMHNVVNACAAASVAAALGMDIGAIVSALAGAEPECGRQEVIHAREGFMVVNDAYNANPDSMRASLLMFSALAISGRRVAVLGDMGELGEYARPCHEDIGALVASLNIDYLICIGEQSHHLLTSACKCGMDANDVYFASSIADILSVLEKNIEEGDAVLVKASHFMGLERVVGGLVN